MEVSSLGNSIARVGRPPMSFDIGIASELCSRLADGRSIRSVCKDTDMPSAQTVYRWLRDVSNGFNEMYAFAKYESATAMAEDILDIADDASNDWVGDGNSRKLNREAIERAKLRISTRQWLMAKMQPRKYWDKLDISNETTQRNRYENLSDEELGARIAAAQAHLLSKPEPVEENPRQSSTTALDS